MAADPDPVLSYSDIAARGSLGAALQALADEAGILVPFTASASRPLGFVSVESTLKYRNPLNITSWAVKRRWSIRGEESFQGLALIDGNTEDLLQIFTAAQAWRDGATLDEVHRAAPFVHLTGRFEVPDSDPALLAESEWQHLRAEAHEHPS